MKRLALMTVMAAAAMGGGVITTSSEVNPRRITGKAKKAPVSKALKLFYIDGVEVWALNKKNAIRKRGTHS